VGAGEKLGVAMEVAASVTEVTPRLPAMTKRLPTVISAKTATMTKPSAK
jgi:hypothetical protein